MAENKKSFVLYCNIIHTVNLLTDDEAGKLFKHVLAYVNDQNPTTDDKTIQIVFEPIKQQLKIDLKKWEGKQKTARTNGQRGGRPPKETEPIHIKFDHLSMTMKEFDKLIEKGFTKQQIDEVILKIQNWKKNKNYKSLYLTCLNWLKKETEPNSGTQRTALENYQNRLKKA